MFVGANAMWILWILIIVTFPITFPLSAIIDKMLGEDSGSKYSMSKFKRLFEMYEKEKLLNH